MKIWKIAGVLSLCTLAGCGNLSAEDEQQLKDGLQEASQQLGGVMEEAGAAWDKAQAEIEAEMAKINWAEKIFTEENSDGKPVRVIKSDGTTVEDMDAFLEAIHVSDWTKVDALPGDVTESGTFALRQNATIELGETVSNTDYKIAQMTVYKEGYVTLEILDGMTKYLDILIPKENFVAVYQVPEDVAAYLQDCCRLNDRQRGGGRCTLLSPFWEDWHFLRCRSSC